MEKKIKEVFENDRGSEKSKEIKIDKLELLAKKIKGKVCLLWGEPYTGKSILSLNISKYFENPVLLLIDTNYPSEYYGINLKLHIIKIDTFQKLLLNLENIKNKEYDFIIIDSITTLASESVIKSESFIRGELSPRVFLILRYLFDAITRKASALKEVGKTVLLIGHSAFDWKNNTYRPSINKLALRNVDLLIRMYVDENGKRKLEFEERKYNGKFEPPEF